MSDLLAEMAASSRDRVDVARARRSLEEVRASASALPSPRPLQLHGRFDLLAEIKLAAPSTGTLAAVSPSERYGLVTKQAKAYAAAGAAAISVLTEPKRFGGNLGDLAAASGAVTTPTMRKDFLVDPYQVWEAREAGASGVLLIARMLGDGALDALCEAAGQAELFVIAEAFDADDVRRCARLAERWVGPQPLLIGVNVRDLVTLAVDRHRLASLAPLLPAGVPAVAESGVEGPEDCARAASLGYRAVLVGSALMRSDDPAALAASLLGAGRGPAPE
jgi:indole-3-glycerol phosphate synthase